MIIYLISFFFWFKNSSDLSTSKRPWPSIPRAYNKMVKYWPTTTTTTTQQNSTNIDFNMFKIILKQKTYSNSVRKKEALTVKFAPILNLTDRFWEENIKAILSYKKREKKLKGESGVKKGTRSFLRTKTNGRLL